MKPFNTVGDWEILSVAPQDPPLVIIDWARLIPEPPEHRACRERTKGEQVAVAMRIHLAGRMACMVCGEHHMDA